MLGVFWKIQEICSKTGTRISKIDGEMSEIIEPKVGNPENSISRNWATLSHPWNLTFLENNIFKPSSYLYGLKVPKWNCAHILLWKKAKNIRKTPKNTCFTTPWLRTTLLNDPVVWGRPAVPRPDLWPCGSAEDGHWKSEQRRLHGLCFGHSLLSWWARLSQAYLHHVSFDLIS